MRSWDAPEVPEVAHRSAGVEATLRLHDTASGEVRPVGPEEGTARMYVCGITPYDATHLGHAFTYLTFDLVNRQWRDLGLDVRFAQNVTDVDEPLLERAEQTGRDWEELAAEQIALFRDDMEALRILPPQHYVGAVESVQTVAGLVDSMRPSGAVYQIDDPDHPDWYFSCVQAPGFGGVSHLDRDTMRRVFGENGGDPDRPGKRDPLDCLVWRFERPGEPSWDSRLGRGRPGWHIECTAIALDFLGPRIDVQGGGTDLAFPHHEMCAAEGLVASHQPFADSYVHVGMVGLDGEKMSKSRGNLEFVSRLRARGVDPMAVRVALLGHHYRENWEWTPEQLDAAVRRLAGWREGLAAAGAVDAGPVVDRLRAALRADLDVVAATGVLDDWAEASRSATETDPAGARLVADAVDALLGVSL
ncbi:MAG TPA: cysteine--1-D-myo-inosityl 2-amino-2-deoxy-alpha-D-glucopyranoside ligase [Propionibacteriaceae bacterium]|nr:cysteine--1-D-myo-inosityl 2-amino-2-deoxy-alpha-D-glucopyranoside ligase [Propionibacteriaceae bacterium]